MTEKKPHCIIEFKLYTAQWQADRLNHMFDCYERMYNTMIRYAKKQLAKLRNDEEYKSLLSSYSELLKNDKLSKSEKALKSTISKRLNEIVKSYGLSQCQFEDYLKINRINAFNGELHSAITQKIALAAWTAVDKVLYSDGKKLHFKKRGAMRSFEGKSNATGIQFDKETNLVTVNKMKMPIKFRHNDNYANTILKNKICYCRIVRKPFKTGYKYFVQLILEGEPPKLELGVGDVGLDQGTSTIAAVGDYNVMINAHGITDTKTDKDYNKEIIHYSRMLERSLRLNNTQNYNEDGTIKSGKLTWVRTKNYCRILFRLKDAYRRKAAFVKQQHGYNINKTLKMGDNFYTEPMNWKALQKRSKKTEKSDKEIVVKTKTGKSKKVLKNKKKKRFGKSLNNHSPGLFEKIVVQKLGYHHKKLNYVNLQTYRASQYNPETKEYNKSGLSDRVKVLFDKLIQRDLLSAFLLQNPMNDLNNIDINKVELKIDKFIAMHDACMAEIATKPNMPECMGLKHFK